MAKERKKNTTRTELSAKEFAFASRFLAGEDPQEIVISLGHPEKHARVTAWRYLNENKRVIKYIDEERTYIEFLRKQATQVDDIFITEKLRQILDRCMQAQAVMRFDRRRGEMVHATDEDTGELLYIFDSAGAIKALENLAKHIGYYELDNRQKQTVIKIGAVQNVQNFFFADEEPEENNTLEIGE